MCVKRPWRERFCSRTMMCSRLACESSFSILVQAGNNSTEIGPVDEKPRTELLLIIMIADKTRVRGIKRGVGVARS
jgi:hypothetical protein